MNLVAVILLLFSVALARSAEPVLSLNYFNNRWVTNTQIEITVDSEGMLALATESKCMNKVPGRVQLPSESLQDLKRELEAVDWKKVSADKIEGRDGTEVSISYEKQSAKLWSPDYDSKRRGLSRI